MSECISGHAYGGDDLCLRCNAVRPGSNILVLALARSFADMMTDDAGEKADNEIFSSHGLLKWDNSDGAYNITPLGQAALLVAKRA